MMQGFLDRIFGREPAKKTSEMAKERLQFILVHDRINIPPERMEAMKKEILEVIAKYVSVDNENVEIALEKRERNSALIAQIPFIKAHEDKEYEDPEEDEALHRPASTAQPNERRSNASANSSAPEAAKDEAPSLDELTETENFSDSPPPAEKPAPPAPKPKPNNTPRRKR